MTTKFDDNLPTKCGVRERDMSRDGREHLTKDVRATLHDAKEVRSVNDSFSGRPAFLFADGNVYVYAVYLVRMQYKHPIWYQLWYRWWVPHLLHKEERVNLTTAIEFAKLSRPQPFWADFSLCHPFLFFLLLFFQTLVKFFTAPRKTVDNSMNNINTVEDCLARYRAALANKNQRAMVDALERAKAVCPSSNSNCLNEIFCPDCPMGGLRVMAGR
jgi:hypothetical protein